MAKQRELQRANPTENGTPGLAQSQRQVSSIEEDLTVNSGLSLAMDNTTQHDFVLQAPERGNRNYVECHIYFFDTPNNIRIEVGQNELARDVIKHIMTLYRHNKSLYEACPLEFPDAPERYSLYFIDDDESEHAPDYDMGPRNPEEPIGEFATLAFTVNKKFKQTMIPGQEGGDASEITHQTEEERKKLEAND